MRYSQPLYSIVIHEDAEDDLDAIYALDEDAGADIDVFLDEAAADQMLLENLSRNGHVEYGDTNYDVKEWVEVKRAHYNLWRLKFFDIPTTATNYRIIYAFHPAEYRYYVLGILIRSDAYDLTNPRNQKILAAYDALCIPRY